MKKLIIASIVPIIAFSLLYAETQSVVKKLDNVNTLNVSGKGIIQLVKSAEESIEIIAETGDLEKIVIENKNGKLKIGYKPLAIIKSTPKFIVGYKNIKNIEIKGSCTLQGENLEFDDISIETSGSSKIDMSMTAKTVKMELSGSSDAKINFNSTKVDIELNGSSKTVASGKIDELKVECNGSSDLDARNCEVKLAYFESSGSTESYIFATEKLKIVMNGSGKLFYKGKPEIKTEISGSSKLIFLEEDKKER